MNSLHIFLLLSLAGNSLAILQCRNERGAPVDWYVMYKLPIITKSKDFLLRRGLAYMYITSSDPNADWTLSHMSINDSKSMPGQTLSPLYGTGNENLLRILYNDEPPSASAGSTFGHTKGVVLAENGGGFWLIHSAPRFPIEPLSPKTNIINKYQYPPSAVRFGQSFLCISLPENQLNVVGSQLMYNKPKVYESNIPDSLLDSFKNLTEAAKSRYIRSPPWYNKAVIKSKAGTSFVSYAKASQFGKDLYSGWLAPDLASDLQVETWANGRGELPSDCRGTYKVMDVVDLAAKFNNTIPVQFKNSQDHSKWAVTLSADTATICIGDINRMEAQLRRGGGTVCIKNKSLWKRYSKIVLGVQPCPK